jgi:hypothetical protein
MKQKKTWFIGFTSRLWVPVSLEGWIVTASFFTGIILIGKINTVSNDVSLSISKIILILLEFIVLLVIFYFLTKGHVDKKY